MTESNPKEFITKYLSDLHALEEHGHRAIARQVDQLKDSGHSEAHRFAVDAAQLLEQHIKMIEERLRTFDESPGSPVKDAAATVTGAVAGLWNAVRSEEASKSIRDDYTFFSHVAIADYMLYTTARGLGDHATAELARTIYRDAAYFVERIDHLMPGLVLQELRQNGMKPSDVTEDALQMLRESWSTGSGPGSPPRRSAQPHTGTSAETPVTRSATSGSTLGR